MKFKFHWNEMILSVVQFVIAYAFVSHGWWIVGILAAMIRVEFK